MYSGTLAVAVMEEIADNLPLDGLNNYREERFIHKK